MTTLLEQAFAEVQRLPPAQQDVIATLILEELADDARWDQAFARSVDILTRLAHKARIDKQSGKATLMGFDEL